MAWHCKQRKKTVTKGGDVYKLKHCVPLNSELTYYETITNIISLWFHIYGTLYIRISHLKPSRSSGFFPLILHTLCLYISLFKA